MIVAGCTCDINRAYTIQTSPVKLRHAPPSFNFQEQRSPLFFLRLLASRGLYLLRTTDFDRKNRYAKFAETQSRGLYRHVSNEKKRHIIKGNLQYMLGSSLLEEPPQIRTHHGSEESLSGVPMHGSASGGTGRNASCISQKQHFFKSLSQVSLSPFLLNPPARISRQP